MTEQDARKKECPIRYIPMLIVGMSKEVSRGEFENLLAEKDCIASDCMLWVWKEKGQFRDIDKKDWTGRCGLAK